MASRSSLPPRLAEVASGALAGFVPATTALREARGEERELLEAEIGRFARDARAILGFERLPEPVLAWATLGPGGEPGLRRALPGGVLELRRFEARFTLFRRERPRGRLGVLVALQRLLGRIALGEPARSERVRLGEEGAEHDLVEWHGSRLLGRFERVLAAFDGKTLLLAFLPEATPSPWERSHESAASELMAAARRRARPPGAMALPSPLDLPPGGRFSRKPRPPRKRPVR